MSAAEADCTVRRMVRRVRCVRACVLPVLLLLSVAAVRACC